MEVIILAGGLGTRLRSVVKDVPKCMAPVAGKPFLWYLLRYLTRFDVNRVILSVGYLREVIFEWIDEVRDTFPFEFDYAVEEEPLGTGGGIKLALGKAESDNIVILNGDTFFDVDLNQLMLQHRDSKAEVTLALKPMKDFDRYGQVLTVGDYISQFIEKKQCDEGDINGGVYVIRRATKLMDDLPRKFSFEKEVLEKNTGSRILAGFRHKGYFIDIGIPEDYSRAETELPQLI